MKKVDQSTKEQIANKVTELLKSKLILNSKMVESKENHIAYKDFISEFNRLTKMLSQIAKGDSQYENLEREYSAFLTKYADKILLSQKEIEELIAYVRLSISTLGMPENNSAYSNSDLIRDALISIAECQQKAGTQIDENLDNFISLACSTPNALCDLDIKGLYMINYGHFSLIVRDGKNTILDVDKEGNIDVCREIDPNSQILPSDLYFDVVRKGNTNVLVLFQVSKDDYGYRVRPLFDEDLDAETLEQTQLAAEKQKDLLTPFEALLDLKGLSFLKEKVYDLDQLEYLLTVLNEYREPYIHAGITKNQSESFIEEIKAEDIFIGAIKGHEKDLFVMIKKQINGFDCFIPLGKKRAYYEQKEIGANNVKTYFRLNTYLAMKNLDYLSEPTYDIKKMEYIIASLNDANLTKSITETPAQEPINKI